MTVKEAYLIASKAIQEFAPGDAKDFRLEQGYYDNPNWQITISYLLPNQNRPDSPLLAGSSVTENLPYERIYKTVHVTDGGEIDGIFIYQR